MIISKLSGGLGNQMFQYALGKKMAIKNNDSLLLDTSIYETDTTHKNYRAFGLAHFNITSPSPATPEQIEKLKYPYGRFLSKILYRLQKSILKRYQVKFEPYILKKTGSLYLIGFWQSEKYFKDVRDTILKEFSLKDPFTAASEALAETIRKDGNTISLHIRRGDYVENAESRRLYGSYCDQEYYARALKFLSDRKGPLSVYVFSDDIEWVRNNITIPHKVTYVPEKSSPDYERMLLMSICRHHIICNSTFGWWGAWLDNKPEKIVIAPSVWIPGLDLPIDDIIPPEWMQM
jgi:hypothetical protein